MDDNWEVLAGRLSGLATQRASEDDTTSALHAVVDVARATIDHCDACGVSMRLGDGYTTVAATAAAVAVDRDQYAAGSGPCIEAMTEGQLRLLPDTSVDERWPDFSRAANAHGVMSVLAVPVVTRSRVVGALNLYSKTRDGYGEQDVELGQLFASSAAVALTSLHQGGRTQRLSDALPALLEEVDLTSRAEGVLMFTDGVDLDTARRQLSSRAAEAGMSRLRAAQAVLDELEGRRPPKSTGGTM